jgi:hypothetical protein
VKGGAYRLRGGQQAIRTDDLAAEARWPIRPTPIRAVPSFGCLPSSVVRTLDLHADYAHAFDHESQEVGLTVATHVALACGTGQRHRQFRNVLTSPDLTGQAEGMLMERVGVEAGAAVELIKLLFEQRKTPAADIAERVARGRRPARNR